MDNNGEKTTTIIIHTLRDALLHFAVKSKKLASPLLEPFGRATEPTTVNDDELMALKSKLRRIRATLRDAESLSVTDCSVQLWLAELGDLENRAEDVVEELDFETILAERKATLISLYPEDQQEAVARTLTLESEPLVKLLEENAYRELIWRQRVNEAARAVMLACAAGNDLDVIGANYNTTRLTITPADDSTIPPTPAVMESDTDYRLRIQQAFEGLSVAGSVGAYQYHGRSADGRVADISVTSPSPACVTISVLSRENNGVASEDLLAVVRNALNGEDVRPVADRVTVQSAAIVEYQINATLYLYPGPESEPIRAAAVKKLEAYITAQHRLGRDIRLSAIYAALHVEGVQRVELAAPLADIVLNNTQASFCTEYSVVTGGSDE